MIIRLLFWPTRIVRIYPNVSSRLKCKRFKVILLSSPSDYIRQMTDRFGLDLFITEYSKGVVHDNNFGLWQVKTKYATLPH